MPADQPLLSTDAILAALHWRYAVKKFDRARKLSDEEWTKLEHALVLAPSSWGLQPYHFIVVTDPALKARLTPASYGQTQVADCSHLVVFAARTDVTDADVEHYMARITEVRGVARAHLDGFANTIKGDMVTGARHAIAHQWCLRQAYIALGQLMTVAALASVDVCPMEGFDIGQYNDILGLHERGLSAGVIAAVGHRAPDDGAASLPKVRFPEGELIEHR